jgi:hypothetical protein
MKLRSRIPMSAVMLVTCVLLLVTRLEAHHSFGAEYDAEKPITLKGVITKIEWANPHSHIYVDVKEAGGTVKNWKFEGYPPNVLDRTGFKKDVTLRQEADPGWLTRARLRSPTERNFILGHRLEPARATR